MSKKGSLEFKTTAGVMKADWVDDQVQVNIERGEYVQVGPFAFSEDDELDEFYNFVKERLGECFE